MYRHAQRLLPALAAGLSILMAAHPQQTRSASADPLEPLLFLVGRWEAQGNGPHGEFHSSTTVQRRGRWLLSTADVRPAAEGPVIFQSTSVYGYDEDGSLVCRLFDTAGNFLFRGTVEGFEDGGNLAQFRWDGPDSWKEFTLRVAADGTTESSYSYREPGLKPPLPAEGSFHGSGRRLE